MIAAFSYNEVPGGWLLCNGAEVSRDTYSDLFEKIGTTYGSGDGSTTFNLPNFIGRTIWGSESAGEVLEAGLPNITGKIGYFKSAGSSFYKDGALYYERTGGGCHDTTSTGPMDVILDASLSNPIYGNSETVQPPALTVRFCIKY